MRALRGVGQKKYIIVDIKYGHAVSLGLTPWKADCTKGLSFAAKKQKGTIDSMTKISVIDQPVKSLVENNQVIRRRDAKSDPDRLGTGQYAETLASFIRQCDTPMTIGVQGEWGSGKTSLLNMIREEIQEEQRERYSTI